ncbi:Protein of unknown function [Gryllus bimaculatus]|nr:Protein of unknown function [Gryllus bimaculatus]
MSAAHQSS